MSGAGLIFAAANTLSAAAPQGTCRCAERDVERRVGEVGEALDARGVAGRHRDLQGVAREGDRRGRGVAGVGHLRHGGGARGGEHVGRRTLLDLGRELRAGGEGERDGAARVARPRTSLPSAVNDSVSDEAASTMTLPVTAVELALAELDVPPALVVPSLLPPQPASASSGTSASSAALGDTDISGASGISTTTLVDLTAATATTPGSSPRSSAASRLISDTTRNGPACSSTWAITPSRVTLVTMPRNRLRADCATTTPGSAGSASRCAAWASTRPSTPCRPDGSRVVSSRPASAQRRTVSSLTPSSSAASAIRRTVTRGDLNRHLRQLPACEVPQPRHAAPCRRTPCGPPPQHYDRETETARRGSPTRDDRDA